MEVAIIMGAGPAGLTAAYELLTKTNIKPIVIEADEQVGGLSKTINYKGNLIDIGGHRFFSKSQKIIDWWLQFLPLDSSFSGNIPISYQNQTKLLQNTAQDDSAEKTTMLVRPRKSRIYYRHHFFDYPLRLNTKTLKNLGFSKTYRIGVSYIKARLFPEKPEKTLAQFFKNRFGKELYNTFFKDYTEKVWGVSCDEIPSDWGKQRIKDLNIWKAVFHYFTSAFFSNKTLSQEGTSTSLIEQFLYPQKGPGQMWETVAKKIVDLGGVIHLSAKVENIMIASGDKIESVTWRDIKTGNISTENGDYFFSSLPIKELINGMKGKTIEQNILSLANGLEYRDFLIVGLILKKAHREKEKNDFGALTDNWIYLQDKGIRAGRVQIFNNWSPFMVEDKDTISIGVEYFCNETDDFWNAPEEQIKQQAIREMENVGLIKAENVTDAKVIKVRKAYPSYTGSYNQFTVLQNFLDGFENLFPVGRNGMHRYNNSDHSMMTAMTAVENIISNRKDKSNIWEVNLDEDYHEEP
jgi:protoporphyrinogen oxidase